MDIVAGNAFSAPLATNAFGDSVQTLTNGDNLTGQGTAPILTAMLNGAGGTTSITSTGVETFNVQNLATAAETINGTITGLKNVAITQATADTLLGGLQSKLETLSLAQTNASNFTATFANSALSGSADAITTTLKDGVTGGAVKLGSLSGTNGYETFNVVSQGSANTIYSIEDTNSSLVNLNLSGNQSLTINRSDLGATPIDVTLTKIDASAMAAATTGGTVPGVTIGGTYKTAANIKDFNTFAPTAATAGAVSFLGGAGNDNLFIAGANVDDRFNITGGDGTDRVTIVGAPAGTAKAPTLKSVEELKLTNKNGAAAGNGYGFGITGATFDLTGVTGVNTILLDGISSGAVTAGGGGVNSGIITINTLGQPATGLTFNLVGDKTADTQTFNGISYAPTGVTGTSSVAVNVGNQGQAIGGANKMTISSLQMTGVPTVTLTGSDMAAGQTLAVNAGLNTAALTSFTAKTGGDLSILSAVGVAAVTTADFLGVAGSVTNNGGTLTIGNASGGSVSLGGSGANNVALTLGGTINASSGTGNQTLTGGAGAVNDTLIGGSGADTIVSGLGVNTITGGKGADTFTTTAGATDTLVFASGDNGATAATADTMGAAFASTVDSIKTGTAGTGANFTDAGAGGGTYAADLAGANAWFAGGVGARMYYFIDDTTNGRLFFDWNKDGTADGSLIMTGTTTMVAADIIA